MLPYGHVNGATVCSFSSSVVTLLKTLAVSIDKYEFLVLSCYRIVVFNSHAFFLPGGLHSPDRGCIEYFTFSSKVCLLSDVTVTL